MRNVFWYVNCSEAQLFFIYPMYLGVEIPSNGLMLISYVSHLLTLDWTKKTPGVLHLSFLPWSPYAMQWSSVTHSWSFGITVA